MSVNNALLGGTFAFIADLPRVLCTQRKKFVWISSKSRDCAPPQIRAFNSISTGGNLRLAKKPTVYEARDRKRLLDLYGIFSADGSRDHGS